MKKKKKRLLTNWFGADVSGPTASEPNISRDLEEPPLCGKLGIDITSPGVWVEGVEGELGDGPVVFAVPELLAGPEDDTGCFLFRTIWVFGALKEQNETISETQTRLYQLFSDNQVHSGKLELWNHLNLDDGKVKHEKQITIIM